MEVFFLVGVRVGGQQDQQLVLLVVRAAAATAVAHLVVIVRQAAIVGRGQPGRPLMVGVPARRLGLTAPGAGVAATRWAMGQRQLLLLRWRRGIPSRRNFAFLRGSGREQGPMLNLLVQHLQLYDPVVYSTNNFMILWCTVLTAL